MEQSELSRQFQMKKSEVSMMKRQGYILNPVYLIIKDALAQKDIKKEQMYNMVFRKFGDVEQFTTLTFNDFMNFRKQAQLFNSRSDFSMMYMNDKGEQAVFIYLEYNPVDGSFSKDSLKDQVYPLIVLTNFASVRKRKFIIVTRKPIPKQYEYLLKTDYPSVQFVFFEDNNLALDITQHGLNPFQVAVIPAQQVPTWQEEEGINAKTNPDILLTDALVKWLGASVDDVIQSVQVGLTTQKIGFYQTVKQYGAGVVSGQTK